MKEVILSGVLFVSSLRVYAAGASFEASCGDDPSVICLENKTGFDTISEVLERVISYLTQLAIPILTIMVMVGAFYMLTAGDNESKFTKGKKTITYAAIGFAIILIGNGFVFIIKEFLGVQQ